MWNMVKKNMLVMFIFLLFPASAKAAVISFEDIPDLTSVGDFYASYGVYFDNAISLTAGFSLNEFDYPPSSGSVAIGDNDAPISITFDSPAKDIFANFTYDSQLTFSTYDQFGTLIGSYINSGLSNLGTTELIPLSFSGVSSLIIAGAVNNSYIMDDFTFTIDQASVVPEPATIFLLTGGLFGLLGFRRKLGSV